MSAGAPPHQVPVVDAARWMLQRAEGDGIAIDLRRLHEICCYAQGLYHVKRGVPLFIEPVLATDAGPVFPAIEAEFRDGDLTPSATPVELPRILQAVVMREAMRTSDAPWRATIAKCSSGTEIAAEEIARFILRSPFGGRGERQLPARLGSGDGSASTPGCDRGSHRTSPASRRPRAPMGLSQSARSAPHVRYQRARTVCGR